jgi:hypothetical protein
VVEVGVRYIDGLKVAVVQSNPIRESLNTDSGNLRLYMLTADKLVDDVSRKQTTGAAARVELQKAYLEFRDRTN